ncbi:amino acid ABC transporter permease [Novosphingobium sp. ERN07]|uniref:amino acid ABC transporter permease n=1 Tax=Novosphingobium sp. ERN07 TaxID=2726187 RepID=UPI00145681EB|nr:amino acid ABC transporter permease [Novosphingobium sp. ERN07]NLR70303.1 amino acid ABC transporter permease [Novosphingobium sp. ERN07]
MTFVQAMTEPRLAPTLRPASPNGLALLFKGGVNLLATLVFVAVIAQALPHLLAWAVMHGVWQGNGDACRDAGACWVFLRQKGPFILFGIYPETQIWRPIAVVTVLVGLALWTMPRAHWTRITAAAWAGGLLLVLALMAGGVAGLSPVPVSSWGGLPVTLLLTVLSLAFGFPLGLALALARRSSLPLIRCCATGFVELLRGIPVVTLLFAASFLAPLLLPDWIRLENLARALGVFTLVSAAYLCEVLRGGLQGVPRSQWESAQALGLGKRDVLFTVILPQAIRKVLPPLTSTIIVVIKNTSLVMVVGLFDLVSAGRVALNDPAWPMPYAETYLMVGLIYFAICYGVTRYSLHLERTLAEDWQ